MLTFLVYIIIGACIWFYIDFGLDAKNKKFHMWLILLLFWPIILLLAIRNSLKEIDDHD